MWDGDWDFGVASVLGMPSREKGQQAESSRMRCRPFSLPERRDFSLQPSTLGCHGVKARELGLKSPHGLLQVQDSAHARDVDSRIGECGDLAEAINFGAGVTPRS